MHPQCPTKEHPLHTPQPVTRTLHGNNILDHGTAPCTPSQLYLIIALRQDYFPDRVNAVQLPVFLRGYIVVEAEPRDVVPEKFGDIKVVP
jgi:hypothetical protein